MGCKIDVMSERYFLCVSVKSKDVKVALKSKFWRAITPHALRGRKPS